MADSSSAVRLPTGDPNEYSDERPGEADDDARSGGARSQACSAAGALEHGLYDVLILEYDDEGSTAVVYVAPVCGAEEAARGGLSVVAVPHVIFRRRLADRVLKSDAVVNSAFLKVRAAEYSSFDTVGEDFGTADAVTLLQAKAEFYGRCRVLDDFEADAVAFGGSRRLGDVIYFLNAADLATGVGSVKKFAAAYHTASDGVARPRGPAAAAADRGIESRLARMEQTFAVLMAKLDGPGAEQPPAPVRQPSAARPAEQPNGRSLLAE